MKIKDLYIELSSNNFAYEKYCSIGNNNFGKIFSFINTNYRAILPMIGQKLGGFAQGYNVLSNVCGTKRSEWQRKYGTLQEIEKQHTVNMKRSELFSVNMDIYNKTSRGLVFEKMLNNEKLGYNEKNFLCYLFICSGYFSEIPNYLFERTKEVFNCYENSGYGLEDVYNIIENFVKKYKTVKNKKKLIFEDYFILDAFFHSFDEMNFLNIFHDSDETDKQKLKEYIYYNYSEKNYADKNNKCILSYKFKPGGVYTFNTLLCNAWMLYITKKISESVISNFDTFINMAIMYYSKLFEVSVDNLKRFIYDTDKNRSVFQVIYCKLFNISVPILEVAKDLSLDEIKAYGKLDSTDEEGSAVLGQITQSLKKIAKLNANYKCEMEECEICKYFTAKETHKTYLEIHHFIPKEFANDFDVSIEDINNYIALCPNCHRKIHLAEDGERKYLINKIFNERKEKLKKVGLEIELSKLYSYYKIDK